VFNLPLYGPHLFDSPKLLRVAGVAPACKLAHRLVLARICGASFVEVINQMHDNVRCPDLPGKSERGRIQHVPVKTEAQFHKTRPDYEMRVFTVFASATVWGSQMWLICSSE